MQGVLLMKKNQISEVLNALKSKIEVPINLSREELNNVPDSFDDDEDYEMTLFFRKGIIDSGYQILKLYAVYRIGWESDNFAADALKDGIAYHVTTSHGSYKYEEIGQ